jgi:hypothetical protein
MENEYHISSNFNPSTSRSLPYLEMSNTNPDILQNDLSVPLQTPTQHLEFARSLWEPQNRHSLTTEHFQPPNFQAYFSFYNQQCRIWQFHRSSPGKTHRQLIEKAHEIAKLDAQQILPHLRSSDETERALMFLAVRVWTMIDVGSLSSSLGLSRVPQHWIHGSLRGFIASTFPSTKRLSDEVELESLFTALNMERIADIQVLWTSNLADHLRFEDDGAVHVFTHVSFLQLHRER